MAASLIGGLRAQGVPAAQIRASDPGAEQRAKIAGEFAIDVVESTPRPWPTPTSWSCRSSRRP